jgi:hypothetical protein
MPAQFCGHAQSSAFFLGGAAPDLGTSRLIRECRRLDAPLLFAEDTLPWQATYDVGAVRDRLEAALVKMRAAANWPWRDSTVSHYRETIWPSLLGKLPDDADRTGLRSELETEISRLDAAP